MGLAFNNYLSLPSFVRIFINMSHSCKIQQAM